MTRGIGQRTAERAMFVPMVTAREYPGKAENDYEKQSCAERES